MDVGHLGSNYLAMTGNKHRTMEYTADVDLKVGNLTLGVMQFERIPAAPPVLQKRKHYDTATVADLMNGHDAYQESEHGA